MQGVPFRVLVEGTPVGGHLKGSPEKGPMEGPL
jgi:hypothetical protein